MSTVVISGITDYGELDEQRFQSCLCFLKNANAEQIPVFLGDGSKNESVRSALVQAVGTRGCIVSQPGASYRERKILSLKAALKWARENSPSTKPAAILLTEMEKANLVSDIWPICQPILSDEADLVIPKRSTQSWASYPHEMTETEGFALDQIEAVTGYRWDTMFGPFAISVEVAHYFLNCDEEMWAWLHEPRFQILKTMPDRVTEVETNFQYPPEQRAAEEHNIRYRLKRLEQHPYTFRPLAKIFA